MVTTSKMWMCVAVWVMTSLYTSLAQQQLSSFRQQSLPRQQQHQSLLGQQRQQQQQERQERRAVREQLSKPVGQQLHHQRLAVWIDKKEIEHYAGVPMDIFVVYDGAVQTYLQDSHFIDAQLPILPPEVYRVKISWMAPDDVYLYRFTTLKSNQPHILYDPLLSISPYGTIPREKGDFEITIPCTGKVSGLASMNLVLRVDDFQGRPIDGSPIKLQLRKRCIVVESKTMCKETCKNGGNCNQHGQCDCTPGYFGPQCQLAACFPDCMNNGSCVKPNQCMCREGFLGFRCESAICKRPCENGGRCSKPNQCECTSGYYGDFCQNRVGLCSVPCKNGGTCTKDNKCECPQGYMGLFCQIPICANSCGVYGQCVAPDTCQCKKGWRGKQCNKNGAKRKKRGPKRRHLKSKKPKNGEQLQIIDKAGDTDTSKVTGQVQGHKGTKNRRRSQHKDKVMATTL